MREAAAAVRNAGVASRMAAATAETQAWIAAQNAAGVFENAPDDDWRALADRIARDSEHR